MLALTGGLRAVSMAGNATRSIRFLSGAFSYLNRSTGNSLGNRKTWTWSAWIKRGTLSQRSVLFSAAVSQTQFTFIEFTALDQLRFFGTDNGSSGTGGEVITSSVYRDTSAWYHIVYVHDETQATASNRNKFYVNGVEITSFATASYSPLNWNNYINANCGHAIGINYKDVPPVTNTNNFDGYFADINHIDGQALTPSSFGQINATTGVWEAKKYSGTYGTNGFYLRFSDTASLGKDFSKLGNNWTSNNISTTAGAAYSSMLDIPTNNYCTLNTLIPPGSDLLIQNGNLRAYVPVKSGINGSCAYGTIGVSSGKWYFEAEFFAASVNPGFYSDIGISLGGSSAVQVGGIAYNSNGSKIINGTTSAYGATYASGDTIGVAYDIDAGTVTFYKNGVSQGIAATGISGTYFPTFTLIRATAYSTTWDPTWGQRPFKYTAPAGYQTLCTANLPTPTVVNGASVMAATAYTGTGSALTITNTRNGVSFQPDFVWMKGRSGATDHALYDVVRGTTKDLASNTVGVETTESTGLTAFAANGFIVGALAKLNTAAATYIAWQWKANGAAVSNTAGTITSQVSTNQTAGFSVITYTGTGTVATVGHGLGVAPSFIIIKNSTTGSTNWIVYSSKLTATNYLQLNTTSSLLTSSGIFNNTEPTLSLFNVGTSVATNNSLDKYVAYCFAEIAGFSKFGSYTGNGAADGPFVYCGFKPRFIMVKVSSTTGDWAMIDTTRSTFNVAGITSSANTATAEAALLSIDILANGFKIRSATLNNTSAATYIFAAWAENSIKYAIAN